MTNLLDSHLSRKSFRSSWALVTANGILMTVCLPLFYIVLKPDLPTFSQILILLLVASLEFLYQIPYYNALKVEDTSIVVLLFNLEKIFVPILAFFFLNEQLTALQYFGFGIIILCSILASTRGSTQTSKRAIAYMTMATFLLALSAVLQKKGLDNMSWSSFYFWVLAFSSPFSLMLFFTSQSIRHEIILFAKSPLNRKHLPLFIQNIATWIGGGFAMVGLSILPVTITKLIESFPALIVHLFASKRIGFWLNGQQEQFSISRAVFILLIGLGAFLTLYR